MNYNEYTPVMRGEAYKLNKLPFVPECLNHVTVLSGDNVVGKIHGIDEACCAALCRGMQNPTHLVVRLMPDYKNWDRVVNQEYLNWVVGESCLSSYYLESSVEEVLERKSVVIRCNEPAALVMDAVLMFRYVWEFPEMTKWWSNLVEAGVDKHHAFVVIHFLRGGEVPRLSSIGSGNSNHHVFPSGVGPGVLGRFKTLSPFNKDELFSKKGKYTWIQNAWSGAVKERQLYDLLSEKCTSKERKVSHAFGTTTVNDSEDIYTQIKKAIDEIIKESV